MPCHSHGLAQFVIAEAGDVGRTDVDGNGATLAPGALVGVDWTFDAWGGTHGGMHTSLFEYLYSKSTHVCSS